MTLELSQAVELVTLVQSWVGAQMLQVRTLIVAQMILVRSLTVAQKMQKRAQIEQFGSENL